MSVELRRDTVAPASWDMVGTATPDDSRMAAPIRILGPLQIVTPAGELPLGSVTQRAILAYLLLHQNQVVATSRLVDALWRGRTPASARKIVQNSVSRLRKILADAASESTSDIWLLTRSPGYQLVMPTSKMDLCQYYGMVNEGRAAMADGSQATAAKIWRRALGLWRGPALADLVEAGMAWPELRMLQDMRLDTMEDLFDIELGSGSHDLVLTELQAAAEANPERERLQILLMLALYRSGRPTDALEAYHQVRSEMDARGLRPGLDLQDMERAIRVNDATLSWKQRSTETPVQKHTVPAPESAPAQVRVAPAPKTRIRSGTLTERKQISVLLLKATPGWTGDEADQEEVDGALGYMDSLIQCEVEHVDGVVTARVGSLWLAVFGVSRNQDDNAHRAVLAAFAIRHGFVDLADKWQRPVIRAAVATGEMLVRFPPTDDELPAVSGTALEECHAMLPSVNPMRVWVNEETHRSTNRKIVYERAAETTWSAVGLRVDPPDVPRIPLTGRQEQVRALTKLLTGPDEPQPPHVVAIVGPAGSGKTRLLEELTRAIDAQPDRDTPLLVNAPTSIDGTAPALLARGLCSCCGITQWDPPELAKTKLRRTIARTARDENEQTWLTGTLSPLVNGSVTWQDPEFADVLIAWWRFVERISAERRVAVIVDDLDCAYRSLGEYVGRLTEPGSTSSLTVIATSRVPPRALHTGWGRDASRTTQIRLPALSDEDIETLVTHLITERGIQTRSQPAEASIKEVAPLTRGIPLLAVQYSNLLTTSLGSGPDRAYAALQPIDCAASALPVPVRQAACAQLDDLAANARSLVLAAAVVGEIVWTQAVVACSERPVEEVEPALGQLIDAGILTKSGSSLVDGDTQYAFADVTTRFIAYSRVPRSQRVSMHARVISWIEQLPSYRAWALLTYYRDQIVRLSSATGQSFDEVLLRSSEHVAHIVGDAVDTIPDVVRYHLVLTTIATTYPLRLNSLVRKWHAWLLAHKRPTHSRRDY